MLSVIRRLLVGAAGFEPATFGSQSQARNPISEANSISCETRGSRRPARVASRPGTQSERHTHHGHSSRGRPELREIPAVAAAALVALAGCDFTHTPLDDQAKGYRALAAQVPIVGRCLVVGDSNLVVPAQQLVDAAQRPPNPSRPSVILDFAAAIPGVGLRDLELLQARLSDPLVTEIPYDCTIVGLGLNDAFAERDHFAEFFTGVAHGLTYAERIEALLALLPDAPIFWIGIPEGAAAPAVAPWIRDAINVELACFEMGMPELCGPDHPVDARMRYVDPEATLAGVEPWFRDGLHYSAAAGVALFEALIERVAAELGP